MPKEPKPLAWILGQGGLLGSALAKQLKSSDEGLPWDLWSEPYSGSFSFQWDETVRLMQQFEQSLEGFKKAMGDSSRWLVLWAAGAGVVGSGPQTLTKESLHFENFLDRMAKIFGPKMAQGTFFFSSSAGGIWGGAREFPITEATPPCPISPYGREKLKQELILERFAESYPGFRVLIGRISNLYGPGQNLSKPQGLLSQLCRSALLQIPMEIFVSLDTVRDYISSEDCARRILNCLMRLSSQRLDSLCATPLGGSEALSYGQSKGDPTSFPSVTHKILASEQPISIRDVVMILKRLTHQEPRLNFPDRAHALQQPKELSFRSTVMIDWCECQPLIEGLATLLHFHESQLQLGVLPFPDAV